MVNQIYTVYEIKVTIRRRNRKNTIPLRNLMELICA